MIFFLKESWESHGSPADHRSESRLSIPQRVALQQSSSPLPQPPSILKQTAEYVHRNSLNGKCLTSALSQPGVHRILFKLERNSRNFGRTLALALGKSLTTP